MRVQILRLCRRRNSGPEECLRVRWLQRGGLVAATLAMLTLTACDRDRGKAFDWKQDAKLHDGRVIIVDRFSRQTPRLSPGNVVLEYEQKLTFTHPDTGERIEWSMPKGVAAWMLGFDESRTYIVLRTSSATDYNAWNCPNPPWIVYRHQGATWERISIDDLPPPLTTPNLLPTARTYEKASDDRRVTLEEMDAFIKELDPPYRAIGRDKINPKARGCYDNVLSEQGRDSEIDMRR